MSEFKSNDERILEGIYNGVTRKIDEVKESVSKEMQYSAAQQSASYDAVAESMRKSMDSVVREIRYLSQQTSAIYDSTQNDNTAFKNSIIEAVNRRTDEMAVYLERKLNEGIAALRKEVMGAGSLTLLEARLSKRLELHAERVVESVEDIEDRLVEAAEVNDKKTAQSIEAMREEILELLNEQALNAKPDQATLAEEVSAQEQMSESLGALREEVLSALNSGFVDLGDRLNDLKNESAEEEAPAATTNATEITSPAARSTQ